MNLYEYLSSHPDCRMESLYGRALHYTNIPRDLHEDVIHEIYIKWMLTEVDNDKTDKQIFAYAASIARTTAADFYYNIVLEVSGVNHSTKQTAPFQFIEVSDIEEIMADPGSEEPNYVQLLLASDIDVSDSHNISNTQKSVISMISHGFSINEVSVALKLTTRAINYQLDKLRKTNLDSLRYKK